MDFTLPASGSITTTNSVDANGLLGPWATVGGTDFATVSGGAIVAYSGYTDVPRLTPGTIADGPTTNVRLVEGSGPAGNITLGAAVTTINTLDQSTFGGSSAATIDLAGQTLVVNSILAGTGAGALTIGIGAGANPGTLKSAGTELIVNNSSTTTINSIIANGTGASALTKAGAGTLTLTGVNTYTGATTINGGILQIGGAGSLGSGTYAGAIVNNGTFEFSSSATQTLSGVLSGTGALLKDTAAGTLTLSGINTFSGPFNVNAGTVTSAAASGGTGTGAFLGGPGAAAAHQVVNIASGAQVSYTNTTANGFLALGATASNGGYGAFYDFNISGTLAINDGAAVSQILQSTFNLQNGGVITNTGTAHTAAYGLLFGWTSAGGGNINVTGTGNQIIADRIGFFNGATITTNAGADLTITSIVKDGNTTAGSLTKAGAGLLVLTNANTFTGATSVNAGTVKLTNALALQSSTVSTIDNGIVFDSSVATNAFTFGGLSGTGAIALANNAATPAAIALTVGANNASPTYSGILSGAGSLVKSGTGIQTLTGANTYAGTTTISAGVLLFGQRNSLYGATTAQWTPANITVNSGAAFGLSVGGAGEFTNSDVTLLLGNLSAVSNNGFKAGSNIAFSTTNASGGTFTVADNIANSTGTGGGAIGLIKLGTGTLVLTGNSSYTGVTNISGGVLSVDTLANGGTTSEIGASTNAAANLVFNSGTLRYTGATVTTDRAFTLNADSTIEVTNAGTTLTIANVATTQGNSHILTKTGNGLLVLGGTADNSSFFFSVANGEVDLAKSVNTVRAVAGFSSVAAGALVKLTGTGTDQIFDGSAAANFGVNGLAGTLDLNGHSETTSNFNGTATGVLTNSAAGTNVTWTVGGANASSAFAGVVQDGSGTIALNKIGTGTQTLSGANTYTGATTLTAGTLTLDYSTSNTSKLSDTGALILNGGTLNINGGTHTEIVGSVTINGGVSITRGTGTAIIALGSYTNNGVLNVAVASLATTTVANNAAGYLDGVLFGGNQLAANDGTGKIIAATGLTYLDLTRLSSGTKVLPNTPGAVARINEGTGTLANITIAAGASDIGSLFQTATGGTTTVDLTGGILRLGAVGSILSGAGASALTIQNGTLTAGGAANTAGTIVIRNGSSNTITISSAIADNGTGAVALRTFGNVTLSTADTYSGGTTVGLGTLSFATGALGTTGAITMNGGTLQWGTSNTQDLSARLTLVAGQTATFDTGANIVSFATGIGGGTSAALAKSGTGTLTLSGVNTYTGATTINAGTLTVSGTGSLGSGNYAGNIANAGTFNWNATGAQTFSGQLSGAGNFNINAGSVTLSGGASLTGAGTGLTDALNVIPTAAGTTLNITGGVYNIANFSLFQETSVTNSTATYNQSAGTVNVSGLFGLGQSTAGGDTSDTNIANFTGGTLTAGTLQLYKWATSSQVNISGSATVTAGTLQIGWSDSSPTGAITVGNGSAGGTLAWGTTTVGANRSYTLSLNGGTIKATQNNASWIPASTFTTAAVKDAGGTIDNGGFNVTIAQVMSHGGTAATDGGLTFAGTGTTTVTSANNYNGATNVNAGSLVVSGSLSGTLVNVNNGGTLGGTGTVTTSNKAFTLASGAQLDPGTNGATGLSISTGTANLDISAGVGGANTGALLYNLNGTTNSDKITLTLGTLAIGSGQLGFSDFAFTTGAGFGQGTYTLFSDAGLSGTLNAGDLTGSIGGLNATLGTSGNDIVLMVVPEPNAAASLLGGICLLLGLRRRRTARVLTDR